MYVCVDPTLLKVDAKARNVFSNYAHRRKRREGGVARRVLGATIDAKCRAETGERERESKGKVLI